MTDSNGRWQIRQDTAVSPLFETKPENPSGYRIAGVVKENQTGEGIPFASVFFSGTGHGVTTDLKGNFSFFVTSLPGDTLKVQAIGYRDGYRIVDPQKYRYGFYIELDRSETELAEFVFRGGEDPAIVLMKNIIRRKPYNNPDRTDNYRYEVYNKLEVDLERLTKEQFEKLPIPYMKKLSFIYDHLDTTSEEVPILPFYLTETLSDYYYQRQPKKTREFIKASLVKGFKNESITRFLGNMYQTMNAYDNFIPVFDKRFVSPISDQGLFYYQYRIADTQEAYGHQIYQVHFVPKRKGEACMAGNFWVADSVFALQRISMDVSEDANINWVKRVSLYQEYAPAGDSFWFSIKEKFIAEFSAMYGFKLPGFIGRKTTSYKNIEINSPAISAVIQNPAYKQEVIVADTARNTSETFWSTARHDTLNKNEKAIYRMIDTLEKSPVFTRYKNMVKFFATGVKEIGPIELGPYWYLYSRNPVEGHRFRFSMGTTPLLFRQVYLNGYLAYGTKDNAFKYKVSGLWILNKKPRMYIYAAHTHDIDRSTSYYDEVSTDNVFSVAARKNGVPWKLSFVKETRAEFFKEYFNGFSHKVTMLHRDFSPYAPLPYKGIFINGNGKTGHAVINTEINFRVRYAWQEKFLEGNYYRFSLGSRYPIVEARFAFGLKDVWHSGYAYQRVSLSVSDQLPVAPIGTLYYNVFAGQYFGTLPYPLLEIHPGNEFHYYNRHAFNMMERFEFISDRYAGFNLEHNIGGGIFNYIPQVRKLKMRQFWTAKLLYGNLSEANKQLNLNKGYPFRTLDRDPYIEVGTGVSNILQLFRIDFVWRLSPKMLPGEPQHKYFSVFGSVQFNF